MNHIQVIALFSESTCLYHVLVKQALFCVFLFLCACGVCVCVSLRLRRERMMKGEEEVVASFIEKATQKNQCQPVSWYKQCFNVYCVSVMVNWKAEGKTPFPIENYFSWLNCVFVATLHVYRPAKTPEVRTVTAEGKKQSYSFWSFHRNSCNKASGAKPASFSQDAAVFLLFCQMKAEMRHLHIINLIPMLVMNV